jgi:hypothetical protein
MRLVLSLLRDPGSKEQGWNSASENSLERLDAMCRSNPSRPGSHPSSFAPNSLHPTQREGIESIKGYRAWLYAQSLRPPWCGCWACYIVRASCAHSYSPFRNSKTARTIPRLATSISDAMYPFAAILIDFVIQENFSALMTSWRYRPKIYASLENMEYVPRDRSSSDRIYTFVKLYFVQSNGWEFNSWKLVG